MSLKINNHYENKKYSNIFFVNQIESSNNASKISFTGLGGVAKSVADKLTKSPSHFSDYISRKNTLNDLLGDEFTKMENELRNMSPNIFNFSKRIIFDDKGGVTFVEDGILPKFFKSALYPFCDLWLDIANWALNAAAGFKKIPAISDFAQKLLNTKALSKRANAANAEETFCILQGAFSDIAKNDKSILKLKKSLTQNIVQKGNNILPVLQEDSRETIVENLAHAAGSIKGNYKTADERTFNRLCTGMVSSIMAGIDFYNISRMQNDSDELAKKSQKKRLKQESSRILMSAAMTFLTLGALSKYANANKYIALFTIAGTTLISEILSRLLNGMPLRPLKPNEAKDFAYHKHEKEIKKKKVSKLSDASNVEKIADADMPKVFEAFSNISKNDNTSTKFKGNYKIEKDEDYTPLNLQNILKTAGVFLLAGIAVCFARSRNEKFNTLLKNIRSGMDDAYDLITKKDFWVRQDKMEEILNRISSEYKLTACAQKLKNALSSDKYEKTIKNINGEKIAFVKLGKVDKKVIAPLIKALTYPFGFIWGVVRFPTKILRGVFEKEASKDLSKITSHDLMGLYKIYNKTQEKLNSGKISLSEFDNFIKRKVLIAAENKTGKSTYKNSSLAAISRPFVTLIASYFFVNDYRNEVLITSEGKDVEGANAVAKERIMHKVSNFFFNSLLMNLFNSVFETAYHGSLLGAGAVAAATEFTNENLIRKSIGVPTRKMTRAEIEEHDRRNIERDDFWGKYFRFMSKLTGKKTISQKVQDEQKKKAKKA